MQSAEVLDTMHFFMSSMGDSEKSSTSVFAAERVETVTVSQTHCLAWFPTVYTAVEAKSHCMVGNCHCIAKYQFGAMCAIP